MSLFFVLLDIMWSSLKLLLVEIRPKGQYAVQNVKWKRFDL